MIENDSPILSIIIPCYNLGDYLDGCLDSISRQFSSQVEYIFVNDGSKDDTLSKLQSFCEDDCRYRLIDKENQGVSKARNSALAVAKGEYLYFLDGDDVLTENAVDRMIDYVEKYNPDVVISDTIMRGSSNDRLSESCLSAGIYTPDCVYDKVTQFPTASQKIYRKSILEANDIIFNPLLKLGEVYDFTIRILAHSKRILVVHDIFFYYMMRDSSATHKPNYRADLTVLKTLFEYDCNGKAFKLYNSFIVTALKMTLSFTYNKYAKIGLCEEDTIQVVREVLKNSIFKEYLRRAIKSTGIPLKERLLYVYIATTGVSGFQLLSRMINFMK